jgi:hypothetical protein
MARVGDKRGACRIFVWKRVRKKQFEIIKPDIKMTLKWILKINLWEGVDWIHLV